MELKSSVFNLKGVGKTRMLQYEKLKVRSIKDLLWHFRVCYINCSEEKFLREVKFCVL